MKCLQVSAFGVVPEILLWESGLVLDVTCWESSGIPAFCLLLLKNGMFLCGDSLTDQIRVLDFEDLTKAFNIPMEKKTKQNTGTAFSSSFLDLERIWKCFISWTPSIFHEFLVLLLMKWNGIHLPEMHSVPYAGSSFWVVLFPGLWAVQSEVVCCGSPFPALNLLCQLWKNRKFILSPLPSSGALKEQFVLARTLQSIFCATDAALTFSQSACSLCGWRKGAKWKFAW